MTTPPSAILHAFAIEPGTITPIEIGNINKTYRVLSRGEPHILQRVNAIFGPEVHHDIQFVTSTLHRAGITTPRLVPTEDARLWVSDSEQGVWRLLTWVEGENYSKVDDPRLVESAGALLAKFHGVFWKSDYVFQHQRPGVHDTPRHIARLRSVLASHTGHVAASQAAPLGEEILARLAALPPLDGLPLRVVHGDPKLNNIMFSPGHQAVALIDLDTVSRMPIPVELGDAFRSWCNPSGEDEPSPEFRLDLFAAGLRGYGSVQGAHLTEAEREAVVPAVETITLELAARFCTDVLEESYFGWNRQRYAAAWEHHLVRARGQLALARSFAQRRSEAQRCVREQLGA